jgi:nucleotide-binding universal stress UspA family protein
LQRQVRGWIGEEFDKITATAGVEVQREVRRGVPEHEILKSVRRYKPDLIVNVSSASSSSRGNVRDALRRITFRGTHPASTDALARELGAMGLL